MASKTIADLQAKKTLAGMFSWHYAGGCVFSAFFLKLK